MMVAASESSMALVESVSRLPAFPSVVGKILATLDDPRSNASHVARYVESDVGLAAQTLRLANSVYYGIPGAVASVSNAVVVLGFRTVRELVIGAALARLADVRPKGMPSLADFWVHSLEVALYTRALGARTKASSDPDTLFAAGLLHDSGRLALQIGLGERYTKIEQQAAREHLALASTEKQHLGYDHGEVSALLAERWDLPESLTATFHYHHAPETSTADAEIAWLVFVADQLSLRRAPERFGYTDDSDNARWSIAKQQLGLAAISDEDLFQLAEQERQSAQTLFTLFS